jgi:hypothetical protein
MIDLFSGLGGASEAFVNHPDWNVIRVELESSCSHVAHTIIGDVNDDHLIRSLPSNADILWMSPPCTEFSTARQPPIENPSLELVERCLEIIEILKPKHWVIENVKGAIKHLDRLLGLPSVIIGGTYVLWGNFPKFTANIEGHSKFNKDPWSSDPLRAQKRAYVPIKISEALRQSLQYQTKLDQYSVKVKSQRSTK